MTDQDKATAVLNERLTGHEQLCMERHNNIREDIKELKTDVHSLTDAVENNTKQNRWMMGVGITIIVLLGLAMEAWRTFG